MPAEQQFPNYPRLAADAVTRQQGKQFLLLSPERGSWCVVDAAGYRLARQCDGNRHWRALAVELASRYDTSLERVLPDVQAYLQQLAGARLLDEVATAHPDRVNTSQAKSPMQVTLHLTSRCNLHCQHCHKPPAIATHPYPSLKTVCNWIDQCVEWKERYAHDAC